MLLSDLNLIHIHALPEPPLPLCELDVVPTHHALPHPAVGRKRPVLQPIAPLPLHPVVRVLVLVPELHGDAVVAEGEELLAQLIVALFLPLGREESDDGVRPAEKRRAVAPYGVGGVCFGDILGVPGGVNGNGR